MKYVVETKDPLDAQMERAFLGTVASFGFTVVPMTSGGRSFERLLRVEDIVRITGLSRSTVYRNIKEGKLKGTKMGDSNRSPIMFTQDEFTKWLSGGKRNDR